MSRQEITRIMIEIPAQEEGIARKFEAKSNYTTKLYLKRFKKTMSPKNNILNFLHKYD